MSTPKIKSKDICALCRLKQPRDLKKGKTIDWVECNCCEGWFHLFCLKIAKSDMKKNYFCASCLRDSNHITELAKVQKSFSESSVNTKGLDIQAIEQLIKDHLDRKWPDLNDKVQSEIQNNISPVLVRLQQLEASVIDLQKQHHQLRLKTLECNIVIRGVDYNVSVEDNGVIDVIARKIGFVLSKNDVVSIRRINNTVSNNNRNLAPQNKSPFIIVSFRDVFIKSNFLSCFFSAIKKGSSIDMSLFEAGTNSNSRKIFIGEHLDKCTLGIYLKSRRLKKMGLIWLYRLQNNSVYIKVKENDPLTIIQSAFELDHFFK